MLVSTQPDSDDYGFDTRQVHAGEVDDRNHGARITPIYLTAAYRFDSFAQAEDRFTGAESGQLYSRNLNPTHEVAERRIASLEGGTGAIVVGSGQAAITALLLGLAGAGERLVSTASIYSGTRILFDRTFAPPGRVDRLRPRSCGRRRVGASDHAADEGDLRRDDPQSERTTSSMSPRSPASHGGTRSP